MQVAKGECNEWDACKYIWQTDKHAPATQGNPVYWARTDGDSTYDDQGVLWKLSAGKKSCWMSN